MRIGVVTFPGSLDDTDAARAVRYAGAVPVSLWHADRDLRGVDAVILPGGFSYGDYLRCGAIARFSPVMAELIPAAKAGLPVLGICNGFQILCEAHLLPGALTRNASRRFIHADVRLVVGNAATAVDLRLHGRPAAHRAAQERRGRVRGRRGHPGRIGAGRPGSRPLRRRGPQRGRPQHRGHLQRRRERGRPDAAPRARDRPVDRPVGRRAGLLHLGRRGVRRVGARGRRGAGVGL